MSVAFRRDSDEEHLEPKFARPIPPGPNLVTAAGMAAIAAETARLDDAVAADDGSDEAALAVLKREQRYWQTRQATAAIAPPPAAGEAGIGSRVRFRLDGAERTVGIVGSDEADGRTLIAFTAPLARALIGAMAGERVDFAGRTEAIELLSVESR